MFEDVIAGLSAAFVAIVVLSCFGRSGTKDTEDSFMVRCKKRTAILLGGLRDQETLDRLATIADVNAGSNRKVGAILREHVPADRPVFVWGFEPVIYDEFARVQAEHHREVPDVPFTGMIAFRK